MSTETQQPAPANWDVPESDQAPVDSNQDPVMDEPIEGSPEAKQEVPPKVFTRNDIVRVIPINIIFPNIYPGYVWKFKLKLKLSEQAEDRRQEYLSFSPMERTIKADAQALDEVCDLITEMPEGFGDLIATGQGPGPSLRSYVETAPDPDMKAFLYMLVNAVDRAYWNAISPMEFRPAI